MYPNYATEEDDLEALGWLGGLFWVAMGMTIIVSFLPGNYHPESPWKGAVSLLGSAAFFAYVVHDRKFAWFLVAVFVFSMVVILLPEVLNRL